MSSNLDAVVAKRNLLINAPGGRILRSFCKRIGWCVCDGDVPDLKVRRANPTRKSVHQKQQEMHVVDQSDAAEATACCSAWSSDGQSAGDNRARNSAAVSMRSSSTDEHGPGSHGNHAKSTLDASSSAERDQQDADPNFPAWPLITNQHNGRVDDPLNFCGSSASRTGSTTATSRIASSRFQEQYRSIMKPTGDPFSQFGNKPQMQVAPRQGNKIWLLQLLLLLILLLLALLAVRKGYVEYLVPTQSGSDGSTSLESKCTSNKLDSSESMERISERKEYDESTARLLSQLADTATNQSRINQMRIQETSYRLQQAIDKLESQVKDLAKRADQFDKEKIDVADLSRSLQDTIDKQLRSQPTKSDHSKLEALVSSLKMSTDARFEQQSSRIDGLQRVTSALAGRGQTASSAPAAVEADQMADYALKSGGAAVIVAQDGKCLSSGWWQRWRHWMQGLPDPDTIISSNAASSALQPGNCWSFAGFPGVVILRLSRPIRVTAVSIDHVSRVRAYNNSVSSAPRQFCVSGLTRVCDLKSRQQLGCFAYDAELGPPTQTFHFLEKSGMASIFKYVLLEIVSNHGNAAYTCLYRFRVHGQM